MRCQWQKMIFFISYHCHFILFLFNKKIFSTCFLILLHFNSTKDTCTPSLSGLKKKEKNL